MERVAQLVEHLTFNQEVMGSNPIALTNKLIVKPGDIGNRTYLQTWVTTSGRTGCRLVAGFLLQVDKAEIVTHEADDPNALVDLLDAEALASEHG
jgi:hypothetical protein